MSGAGADQLDRLAALARKFGWSWQPAAREAFARLDPAIWQATDQNPIRRRLRLSPARIAAVATDPEIRRADAAALAEFAAIQSVEPAATWAGRHAPEPINCSAIDVCISAEAIEDAQTGHEAEKG